MQACLVFAASLIATAASSAQAFPEKPIRMITELAAGSGGDVYLRRLLPHISSALGQPVVLDNRAGAGGVVAAEFVARAAPDGYTVLAATQNALIMRRFLAKTNSVDVFRDLVAVSEVWKATTLIVAGPTVRAKSSRRAHRVRKSESRQGFLERVMNLGLYFERAYWHIVGMKRPPSVRKPYPSDVSDEEWSFVVPYLTLIRLDGEKREHDLRAVFNALRWLVRTGASWRMMPHEFPPWAAVYQQMRRWLEPAASRPWCTICGCCCASMRAARGSPAP